MMRLAWILLALRGACAADKRLVRREAQIQPDPVAPVEGAPEEPGQRPTVDSGHKTVSIDTQGRARVVTEEGASGAAPGASAGGLPGFDQDTPGNATDAAATGAADGASDAELGAARRLLGSDCGPLVFLYANALMDIGKYWVKTVQHGDNSSVREHERPSLEALRGLMADWRRELGAHSRAGTCSEGVFAIGECMALTECIIQSSACEAAVPRQVFATVVELEDEIKTSVWPDFELHFSPTPEEVVEGHSCHKPIQEALEAPAGPSFPVVDQVRGAAALMAQVLAPAANSSLLALLKVEDLHGIWRDACAGLGCDPASWLDIMDSLHGHTAELVSSQAPIRVIGRHIRTMRSSHNAFKHALGRLSGVLGVFLGQVTEREEAKQRSNTKLYDTAIKEGGRVLDAAAQLWWKKEWKKPKWLCVGVGIACGAAWVKKFPIPDPLSAWGVVFGFGIKATLLKIDEKLKDDIRHILSAQWHKLHSCFHATLFAGLLIGFVPGPPELLGVRAGVFGAATMNFKACSNSKKALKFSLSAGLSGAVVSRFTFSTAEPAMIFDFAPFFPAVTSCGVGLTLVCCTVQVYPEVKESCK